MAQKRKKQKQQQPIDTFFAATKNTVSNPATQHFPAMPPAKPKSKTVATSKSDANKGPIALSKSGPKIGATSKSDSHIAIAYVDLTETANTTMSSYLWTRRLTQP